MAKILENISLKSYNSFHVEAMADRIVEFDSYDDLHTVLTQNPHLLQSSWGVLGGGNNTLFTQDYHGTLFHSTGKNITILEQGDHHTTIKAEAGIEWDDLVEWCVQRDLWGIENLSLIPGHVGAAPVQNIGAYGVEAKDVIVSVEMLAVDGLGKVVLLKEFCNFGYRESVFKHALKGKVIITAVTMRFSKNENPQLGYGQVANEVEALGGATLRNIRQAVIQIREGKLPDPKVIGNAGSFFKNPIVTCEVADRLKESYPDMPSYPASEGVKLASGWMIDQAGWKGRTIGAVGVHSKQALVLVNHGEGSGEEIIALSKMIVEDVKNKFGVEITPEVNIL